MHHIALTLLKPYRSLLQLDSVALYSVADEFSGKRVAELLHVLALPCLVKESPMYSLLNDSGSETNSVTNSTLAIGSRSLIVTDACACTGGLTFCLARKFSLVHSVEYEAERLQMLRANTILAGLSNVDFFGGDYSLLSATLSIMATGTDTLSML